MKGGRNSYLPGQTIKLKNSTIHNIMDPFILGQCFPLQPGYMNFATHKIFRSIEQGANRVTDQKLVYWEFDCLCVPLPWDVLWPKKGFAWFLGLSCW
ncbi:hypothetical protein E2C01_086396 [Portunus trituberculatus]|uniref:Uncharacterized protein n=1 Tax=Portunus trituberculatus TaxID=210409 RepID=A0A5B7J9K4_PORTR|nr:hypothetical protein [Portunus trituberculatus]